VPAAPESDAAEDATSEASLIATLGSVDVSDAAEAAGTPRGGATDDGNEEEAPPTERSAAVAREEADALLTFCFWQACHRVSDKELPMATNAFWAAHMRPLRPAGSSLEFRGSSWKKLGAFLKHMASQGCCELDEPKSAKSGSEPMLRQIVRGSAGYQEHVPMENTAEAAEAAARAADHGIGAPPVSVTRCFRPSEAQRGIFEAAGCSTADRKALYSEADVKGVLDAYLKSEGLLGERAMVTLSPGLTDALFRKDDAGTRPTALAAHECKKRWLDRLEGWWRISGGTLEKPTLCKSPPRVEISTTKRRGHDVTLVANLSALGIEEATFAAEAQKLASCAVTIEEIEASKQGKVHKVVVVQGLWDRSISEHLAGTLPAAAIDNKAAAKGGQMAQKKDKKATNGRRA
jgi:translation initiation factor 1 (eIF-1/SUI1)